jgi:branched-chain amino acid transport system permease protein
MHANVLVEAFVVVVIGGMGSVTGAFLGALLIGILQALGILFLPRGFDLAIMFVLMAAVLIVRPWGLLGRPEAYVRPVTEIVGTGLAGMRRIPPGPLASFLLVLLLLPLVLPTFYVWLVVEILAFSLFAGSLQLLLGTGGMISFGHAAYFGLGAYGAALLLKTGGLPMPLAFTLAPVVAGLFAFAFGYFCVRLAGVYFAMLTLAFAQIAYAVVHQWYAVTGGDNGILGVWPASILASPVRYYYLALLTAAGGLFLLRRITDSPFGYLLRAARDHAPRAAAVGIDVRTQQWLAFALAGFFAGVGGGIFAFLKGSVFPDYLSIPVSVEGLVMGLLGGLHVLAGAPVGAALYKLLDTLITNATDYWQAALGAILILMVLALPQGILGWIITRGRRSGDDG